MTKILNSVLLIDDDQDCNYFHSMILEEMDVTRNIYTSRNGEEALNFLKSVIGGKYPRPDIIFLDINMPKVDGWEFLEEYEHLDDLQKAKIVLVMLSTSLNSDDMDRARRNPAVRGFYNKYLTEDMVQSILSKYF